MKLVIDEGVPKQLAQALRKLGIDAASLHKSWFGKSNGELIALADAAGYDVLLTNDRNIAFQQSLQKRSIAVVALPLNRRSVVLERIDDIADSVHRARPGQHVLMNLDGSRTARIVVDGKTFVENWPAISAFEK